MSEKEREGERGVEGGAEEREGREREKEREREKPHVHAQSAIVFFAVDVVEPTD